ncbi:MAG: glycosyltransferase family 39 protein [Thermoleophilaceae bacterium]|nr:glycosyltransferase family 39 protein [Thermoleophilaceae bacterium]
MTTFDRPAEAPARARAPLARPSAETWCVAALAVAAGLAYWLLARSSPLPVVFPDELIYGDAARSFAAGHGLTMRGVSASVPNPLYVVLASPAWIVGGSASAFSVVHAINALVAPLVAIPTWLLARRIVGPRLALAPAALSLAGTWMLLTSELLTENLAYPLAAAALAAAYAALRDPRSRARVPLIVLLALATFTRIQLAVLWPALLAALLLDAFRQAPGRRLPRLRAHRALLAALGGVTTAGLAYFAARGWDSVGLYESLRGFSPGLGRVIRRSGAQGLGLVAMSGVAPAAAALALMGRRDNWRDEAVGPLLCVIAATSAALVLESGWFLADVRSWIVERYVGYVAPLLLVAPVVARGRISFRAGALAAAVLTVPLAFLPAQGEPWESKATSALRARGGDLLPGHPALGSMLIALAAALLGAWLVVGAPGAPRRASRRTRRETARARARDRARRHASAASAPSRARASARPVPPRAPSRLSRALAAAARLRTPTAGAVAVVLALLVLELQWGAAYQAGIVRDERALLPADRAWIDHALGPGVRAGILEIDQQLLDSNHLNELFNESVQADYALPTADGLGPGAHCRVAVAGDGTLTTRTPGCAQPPRALLVEPGLHRPRFHAEVKRIHTERSGTLVEVGGARPRLLSYLTPPCNPATGRCTSLLRLQVWADRPGRVWFRFGGGSERGNFALVVGGDIHDLPPGRSTTFSVPVERRYNDIRLRLSWLRAEGAPQLERIVLRDAGGAISL